MQVKKPESKSAQVRQMFGAIAARYDVLNHVLSFSTDRRWRRVTVERLRPTLQRPGALALDVCCGTADLTPELGHYASAIGVDFCHPMLVLGREKLDRHNASATLTEGDALGLPFFDEQFDVVTIAFGLRNLESIERGLREIYRVLKPGGLAAILEFSRPIVPVFRQLFGFYFRHILPRVGTLVSGVDGPYQYLRDSVQTFLDQDQLAAMMREVEFTNVSYHNLTGGVAALHIGERL